MTRKADEPCTAVVTPGDRGGLDIALNVPTWDGNVELHLTAERDRSGDWVVAIPWTDQWTDRPIVIHGGYEVMNGVVYLGAPDVPASPGATADDDPTADGTRNRAAR